MAVDMRIVVAMSGGVDSSVAAAILKQAGHDVHGVTMKIWDGPALPEGQHHGCYGPGEEADIDDARRVAQSLGVPFQVLDLTGEYRSEVLDYFRAEYASGRTPNPCSRCNPRIKFGALARKVEESGITFDRFATGHYARVEYDSSLDRYLLRKAVDHSKDQSYFLALLSREQLGRSFFPLGGYAKIQVRQFAAEFGLPVADKADSQDFVSGDRDWLLGGHVPGPILDGKGNLLGEHRGIAYHTIGQRKGLGVFAAAPVYVTALDPSRNAVIVGDRSEIYGDRLVASGVNWIAIDGLEKPMELKARIRYRHEEAEATVSPMGKSRVRVRFHRPQMAITPGQTVVFYDGDVVVGGATIENTKE